MILSVDSSESRWKIYSLLRDIELPRNIERRVHGPTGQMVKNRTAFGNVTMDSGGSVFIKDKKKLYTRLNFITYQLRIGLLYMAATVVVFLADDLVRRAKYEEEKRKMVSRLLTPQPPKEANEGVWDEETERQTQNSSLHSSRKMNATLLLGGWTLAMDNRYFISLYVAGKTEWHAQWPDIHTPFDEQIDRYIHYQTTAWSFRWYSSHLFNSTQREFAAGGFCKSDLRIADDSSSHNRKRYKVPPN